MAKAPNAEQRTNWLTLIDNAHKALHIEGGWWVRWQPHQPWCFYRGW